ncbi:MAG: GIY-YIG nuclease family protein [Candidatus Edwardsbacteria bacterium]|jgi:hypothetical protein|nr:GIY-YIG nuclease family protein [Candidatus Edwardsbacteria bacterium]
MAIDRKQLIREYKQTPTPMGVLRIRNDADGRAYLLSAANLPGIINSQRFSLDHGSHPNAELQADYARLGRERFTFEVLDRLEPTEGAGHDYRRDLEGLLELWLEKLQPYGDQGYHTRR